MIPLALAAATYKWIDDRGVVNLRQCAARCGATG
jgi:hypothetical protein